MKLDYKFIGWCKEGIHDKVWGVIRVGDSKCLTFWGRRGAKLQTKIVIDNWDLHKLIDSKEKKGYEWVDEDLLSDVYPEFQSDLEKTTMWKLLCL